MITKIKRGGSWDYWLVSALTTLRYWTATPDFAFDDVGFRVVRRKR